MKHRIIGQCMQGIICLLYAISAVSCQNTTHSAQAGPATPDRGHWTKVSSSPPTYYPRGVPVGIPTEHWSGEWVYTGDDLGSRYFIPFHGASRSGADRKQLVNEALSARSERKLEAIAAEDREALARDVRNIALFGPPLLVGMVAAGMGGGNIGYMDIHEMEKDWRKCKNLD